MLFFLAAWTSIFAVYICADTIQDKEFLYKLWDPFSLAVPVLLFAFTAIHCGKDRWITRRNLILMFIVPVIIAMSVLTMDLHSLYISNISMDGSSVPYWLEFEPGPLYLLEAAYCLGLIIASAVLLIRSMIGATSLHIKQNILLLIAVLLPTLAQALSYLGAPGMDYTSSFFTLTGLIYIIGLIHFRILDVDPIARGQIVENMNDVLLIIDNKDRLIDFNQAAVNTLLNKRTVFTGVPTLDILPFDPDFIRRYRDVESFRTEVVLQEGMKKLVMDASIKPVTVRGKVRGRMILMRDITERKEMETALHLANSKLCLLSSLTRHDLMNKLVAIDGYLTLAKMEQDEKKLREYLSKLDGALKGTHSLIMFTKDYDELGAREPIWNDVSALVQRSSCQLDLGGIAVHSSLQGVRIYGDILLEKVFYSLMENSVRHGMTVTDIRFWYEMSEEGMILVYEDNGVGIPQPEKEKIFERCYGKHTGLGLFLSREILATLGIKISESGVPGKGAQFKMIIPKGLFKVEENSCQP